MKKWIIGLTICAIFLFLIYRLFTQHVSGVKTEKVWFLSKLNYDVSGIIDTVNQPNHILFHVTRGRLDTTTEKELNKQLKHWGELILLRFEDDKIELLTGAAKYQKGDSIYLNSELNTVKIYRGKRVISETQLLGLLRGKPF